MHSPPEHRPSVLEFLSSHQTPASDPLDCFNDDLVWIIDRLVSRTGGTFGTVSRHIVDNDVVTILARTTEAPAEDDSLYPALVQVTAVVAMGESPLNEDVPKLVKKPFAISDSDASYWTLHMAFAPTQTVRLVASVCRPQSLDPFNPIEEITAQKLYPVLSRYVRLWWLHRSERRRANSLSAALDLSDLGVMLLDRTARMLFANNRARAILELRDGLRTKDGMIGATNSHDAIRLQAAIQHALQVNRQPELTDDGQKAAPVLRINRSATQRALIVTAVSFERVAVDSHDPAVIIYAFDPDQNVEQLLLPACDLYQLTPVESRLVRHLVRGLRLADAADQMRIRPDTARDYLKQIFTKTMTHRQADLIRVMLGSMMRTNVKVDTTLI